MNNLHSEYEDNPEVSEQVEVDDSPTGLTTAPIRGYTALNSKEKVEVIERVAPVISNPIPKSISAQGQQSHADFESTPGGYGNLTKSKSYGGISGYSSLLQQRLRGGNIQHFDSGEHFRQQAEKTREVQYQRKLEVKHHPLTGETSSHLHATSPMNSSLPSAPESVQPIEGGRIGRFRNYSAPGLLGRKRQDAVPRRFKASDDSSDESYD